MSAEPWSKWFWTDYEADPGLRMSSLAAQGLWMRMLCLMAKATPKGELRVGGEPCTVADLAIYVGQPEETVAALIEELERRGVFSRTRAGVIYNRRLRNDAKLSRIRSEAGAKGAAATNGKLRRNSSLPRQNSGKGSGKSPAPEARSQNSVPNGTAVPATLSERLWGDGLKYLLRTGMVEDKARGQLGKWRKALGGADGGDAKLLALIADCQAKAISDPNTYIEQAVRKSRAPADERQAFIEREYGQGRQPRFALLPDDEDEL